MKRTLLIIGAGGHGKVVYDVAVAMGKWTHVWFLDDHKSKNQICGVSKVIGKATDAIALCRELEADCFVAIGNNSTRKHLLEMLECNNMLVPALVHPTAILGSSVELGSGSVVMAGVVINAFSKIGKGCIINTSSSVDHDNLIGDYVHLSPGVKTAGEVEIGDESWLGIGSIVSNNVKIASKCILGAGAVVIKNIDEWGTYVGVPVRKVSK